MSQNTAATGLQGRYATALFELASSADQLDVVKGDLELLDQAIVESDDLRNVLRSPVISRDVQANAMAALLDKLGVSELTKKTVGLLCQKRRLFVLPGVIKAYLSMLSAHRGEVTAQVTSATALKDEQIEAVTGALKEVVGATVKVDLNVDPAVLGGLVVKVGSRVFDASLRTKLQKLELAMKGVA
ncbi:F0F1 ATP synthase subunit delta [Thalassospira marina]|uniref:ATP synthase subunit delta n=1 Tax=Thalassospira marina TaxID=2048283 RepID=A0A2N3KJ53_9PROT|nr:F0F1 ATP synthase subunit delta [Thalassospira marina]AUG51570.1 F0F1 ATP synthase subunit delta [Thalassospira marina]PKR50550.1 F0F1 ATP synthase subunit delta [Thalassospira marina]